MVYNKTFLIRCTFCYLHIKTLLQVKGEFPYEEGISKLEPNPISNITGNKNAASVIQTLRPSHPGQPAIVVVKSKSPNKYSAMTLQQIDLERKVHIAFSF